MAKLSDPVGYLAEHYTYELEMLRWTHNALREGAGGKLAHPFLSNALIESFCIHARALIAFFDKPAVKADVIAKDFCPHFDAGASMCGTDTYVKLDQQIAHMTTARESAKKIDCGDRERLRTGIELKHAMFRAALSPDQAAMIPKVDPKYVA